MANVNSSLFFDFGNKSQRKINILFITTICIINEMMMKSHV